MTAIARDSNLRRLFSLVTTWRAVVLLCVVGRHRWQWVLRWEARASIHIRVMGRVCERCRARHRVDERNLAAIRSAWRAAEGGDA